VTNPQIMMTETINNFYNDGRDFYD